MTVYSVFEPPGDEADIEARADKVTFVKEGIAWLALFFPAVWLLFNRMWIELVVFLIVIGLLPWLFGGGAAGRELGGWASLGLSVLVAFVANDLRGWSLRRRGYRFAAAVYGRDRMEVEREFFTGWLAEQERRAARTKVIAQTKTAPMTMPYRPAGGGEVIGSFPRA